MSEREREREEDCIWFLGYKSHNDNRGLGG